MSRRRARAALVHAAVLAACLAGVSRAQDDEAVPGVLVFTRWQAGAFGRSAAGDAVLLANHDGDCRLEIAADTADPAALLERQGRGWTVVLGVAGTGVLQPWDAPWTRLDDRLAPLLAAAARALADTSGPGGLRPAERLVLRPAGPAPALRQALAVRGRGRGGDGEVLRIDRRGGVLHLRSSRRAAGVRLGDIRRVPVRYLEPDAFVPLWPLTDVIVRRGEIPGTGTPPGR